MSDLFHENMPVDFLEKIVQTMNECDQHIFQVLTKRADRMLDFLHNREINAHVWVGVTVENKKNEYRIDLLREIKAKVRFLSIEPMLEAIPNMNLQGIDWVIVGGESGRNARPIRKEWIEDIQRQCEKQKTHFFFKQWGGLRKKQNGNLLNGKLYQEYPPDYQKWQQLLNDQYESGALYR
jgi:protein gp37